MGFLTFMSREAMTSAASAVDQALYLHDQWCRHIYSTLICRLPVDERDVSETPHRKCPFGQWYYGQQDEHLLQHPGFKAVAGEHERLHAAAAHMLMVSQSGQQVTFTDYEAFTNAVSRMRAEMAGLQHELQDALTNIDPLTGATSRVGMLTKLRNQQELVKRAVQPCTIAMMDLDSFKTINDMYGHPAGDTVLKAVAARVLQTLRPYDEFFRYGGEEFLLCSPGSGADAGMQLVERVRQEVAAAQVELGAGRSIQLTASFGVTLLDPDVPVEDSIARADKALYHAKAAGRNRTVAWDPSLDA